jgi:hypothetical protein
VSLEAGPVEIGKFSSVAEAVDYARDMDSGFDSAFDASAILDTDPDLDVTAEPTSFFDSVMDGLASPLSDKGLDGNVPDASQQNTLSAPQTHNIKAADTTQGLQQPTSNQKHMDGQQTAQASAETGVEQSKRQEATIEKAIEKSQPDNASAEPSQVSAGGVATNAAIGGLATAAAHTLGGPIVGAAVQMFSTANTGMDLVKMGMQVSSTEPMAPKGGKNSQFLSEQQEKRSSALHDASFFSSSSKAGYVSRASEGGEMSTGSFAAQIAPKMDPNGTNELQNTLQKTQEATFCFSQAAKGGQDYKELSPKELEASELARAAESMRDGGKQGEVLAIAELRPDEAKTIQMPTLG